MRFLEVKNNMAKILLVDDDMLMLKMYQGKFEDDGYDVEMATNGEQGLIKVVEFKPDLILLDILMPGINGLQVLKKLKEREETKKIPVILLTNVGGSDEDVERGLGLGAVAYMVKAHYDAKDVVKKVKEILGGYVHDLPKVEVTIGDKDGKKANVEKEVQNAKAELRKAQKRVEETSKKLEEIT
jgi:DNA-binding response OmpR family regulator